MEKKVTKKKTRRKKIEPKEKSLSKEELLQLELNYKTQAEINMEIQLIAAEVKLLQMQKELLVKEAKLMDHRIGDKNRNIADIKTKQNSIKETHRNYMESLKMKYEIQGSFGYDPESGVLKED